MDSSDKPRHAEEKYLCNNCKWLGSSQLLDTDVVETCFGNDEIEVCPSCGSYEIKKLNNAPS